MIEIRTPIIETKSSDDRDQELRWSRQELRLSRQELRWSRQELRWSRQKSGTVIVLQTRGWGDCLFRWCSIDSRGIEGASINCRPLGSRIRVESGTDSTDFQSPPLFVGMPNAPLFKLYRLYNIVYRVKLRQRPRKLHTSAALNVTCSIYKCQLIWQPRQLQLYSNRSDDRSSKRSDDRSSNRSDDRDLGVSDKDDKVERERLSPWL